MSFASEADPQYVITDVAIVSTPTSAPQHYYVLDQTSTGGSSADLWKDRISILRKTRFLCYRKTRLKDCDPKSPVLVALSVAREGDRGPHGFDPIRNTIDSGEAAGRKKLVYTKYSTLESTRIAVTDIQIASYHLSSHKEYTNAGELNSLFILYRSLPLKNTGSPTSGGDHSSSQMSVRRAAPGPPSQPEIFAFATKRRGSVHPLTGVPMQLNKKYARDDIVEDDKFLTMPLKTANQLEFEYEYGFALERSLMLL